MNLVLAGKFPLDQDLSNLSRQLTKRNIVHRFTEENFEQHLWIAEDASQEQIQEAVEAFKQDPSHRVQEDTDTEQSAFKLSAYVAQIPITLIIMLLGIIGFLLVHTYGNSRLLYMLYFASPEKILQTGQVWRLITPAFLHFGLFHILFNSLCIWDFGQRIEKYLTTSRYCILFLGTALAANFLQYYIGESIRFGGLSGVVFGYIGFLWIASTRFNIHPLIVPRGLFYFMAAFLLLGFSGLFEMTFGLRMANWAHLGGLLAGVGLGALLLKPSNETTKS